MAKVGVSEGTRVKVSNGNSYINRVGFRGIKTITREKERANDSLINKYLITFF